MIDVHHGAGLPPARIPVDHQSGDEAVLELLIPQVIAAQAREEDIVAVTSIADSILPEWAVLSHGARQAFVRRVEALLMGLAAGELRGQFRFERAQGTGDRGGRIIIETTPATHDPRGRTRAWQAQQNRARRALNRPHTRQPSGQMSIDDLADQGGLADE